jgi:hypothetical protein
MAKILDAASLNSGFQHQSFFQNSSMNSITHNQKKEKIEKNAERS